MTTIVTRSGKGSPLTHVEVDTNFTNLNTNKLEAGAIALGSAATPSISFTGDTNTGIYSPGADQLAVATNGTQRLLIDSGGITSTNGGVFSGDVTSYGVQGLVLTFNSNNSEIRACRSGGNYSSLLFFTPGANSSGVQAERVRITSEGLVGIGTSSPTSKLDVRGSAADFDGLRVLNTDSSSGTQTSSAIRLGITNSIGIRNCRIQATELNTDSNSVHLDFYTNDANAVDSETIKMRLTGGGLLGIGTTSPIATIDITGTGECMRIQSTTAASNYITHKHNSSGDIAYIGAAGGGALTSGANTDYAIRANQGALLFGTNGNNERARIDSSGRLLVGTSSESNTGGTLCVNNGIGIVNNTTERFATVEHGNGASGTFTTITIVATVQNNATSVIFETLMTGFSGVYLDNVIGQYAGATAVTMRNNASAGTSAALTVNGAGTTYTLTITTTGVTHPVVKAKVTAGGLSGDITLPTITFA